MKTPECESARRLLDAFEANELDGVTSMHVQEHLDECADCRRQWQWLQETDASLARVRAAAPPAPVSLRQKIEGRRRRLQVATWTARAAAMAVFALLVGTGGWAWQRNAPKDPMPFVVSHLKHSVRTEPLGIATTDADAAKGWLNEKLPFQIAAPQLPPSGFQLAGARTCLVNDRRVGVLVYTDDTGRQLSLFVGAPGDCLTKGTARLTAGNLTVHTVDCEGTPLAAWEEARNSYLLAGELPRERLLAFASQ